MRYFDDLQAACIQSDLHPQELTIFPMYYHMCACPPHLSRPVTTQGANETFVGLRSMLGMTMALYSVLEEPSKWGLVVDTLREIVADIQSNPPDDGCERQLHRSRVLILAKDDRTAQHLRDIISKGGQPLMQARFQHFLAQTNAKIRRQVLQAGFMIIACANGV